MKGLHIDQAIMYFNFIRSWKTEFPIDKNEEEKYTDFFWTLVRPFMLYKKVNTLFQLKEIYCSYKTHGKFTWEVTNSSLSSEGNEFLTYVSYDDLKKILKNDTTKFFDSIIKECIFHKNQVEFRQQNERDFSVYLCNTIFYHVIKSLLNAEYLVDDKYSDKIDTVTKNFEKSLENDELSQNDVSLQLEFSFLKICFYIISACQKINDQLSYREKKSLLIGTDFEQKINTYYNIAQVKSLFGKRETELYELFTKLVIEMTVIDHIYRSNSENVDKLSNLIKISKHIEKLSSRNPFDSKDIRHVLKLSIIKAHTLLDGIKQKNTDRYKIYKKGKYNLEEEGSKKTEEENGVNTYSLYRQNDIKKDKSIDDKINLYNEFPKDDHPLSSNDIKRYNEDVCFCLDRDEKIYGFWKELNSSEGRTLEEVLKDLTQNNISNVSLLYKIINHTRIKFDELNSYVTTDYYESLLKSFKTLLDRLYIIYTNSEGNYTPSLLRPYFQDSFYKCIFDKDKDKDKVERIEKYNTPNEEYDGKNFEDCFFIVSFDCTPISPNYVKDFYKYYKEKYNELYQKKMLLNFSKENKKLQEEQKEEFDKHNKNQIEKTITILGVFTAILAFVSATTVSFKIVNSIEEYIKFTFTFTMGLISFVIVLKFIINNDSNKKLIIHSILLFLVILLLLSSITFSLYYLLHSTHIGNL
ncbi:hypothetical protein [Capnocytophaga canis]|uniref:hypothetical protein n=1 Tax=Capnocytophaga canis TaxID=1848903 RepID=UPI001562A0DE|nr:hypothetical protein [Capnocytophaga canis]